MSLTKKKTNNNVFLRELALFSRERGRIKENVLKHTHSGWGEKETEMTFPASPENKAWDKNLGQEFFWKNKECYSRLYMK